MPLVEQQLLFVAADAAAGAEEQQEDGNSSAGGKEELSITGMPRRSLIGRNLLAEQNQLPILEVASVGGRTPPIEEVNIRSLWLFQS